MTDTGGVASKLAGGFLSGRERGLGFWTAAPEGRGFCGTTVCTFACSNVSVAAGCWVSPKVSSLVLANKAVAWIPLKTTQVTVKTAIDLANKRFILEKYFPGFFRHLFSIELRRRKFTIAS